MAVYNLLVDSYGSVLVMIMLLFCFARIGVVYYTVMAVMELRSEHAAVTSCPMDLDPNPLGPADPIR